MEFIRLLFALISLVSLLFLIAGLIKPWVMLWWEDVQNRRKVIKVYGTIVLVAGITYYLLGLSKI